MSNKFKISDNLGQLRPYHSSNADNQLNNELINSHFHVHAHNTQHQPSNYPQSIDTNQPFISQLLIYDFGISDIGNYSCRSIPQYSEAANITVNMINEENQLFFSNHYYSNQFHLTGFNWSTFLIILILFNFNSNFILTF